MPSPDQIARVLVSADLMGMRAAAVLCGVSERTVTRYRSEYSDLSAHPDVAEIVHTLKASADTDWIARTGEMRAELLGIVMDLARTATHDQMRDVVGALKIVHDANHSERIIKHGLDQRGFGAASEAGQTPRGNGYGGTKH